MPVGEVGHNLFIDLVVELHEVEERKKRLQKVLDIIDKVHSQLSNFLNDLRFRYVLHSLTRQNMPLRI